MIDAKNREKESRERVLTPQLREEYNLDSHICLDRLDCSILESDMVRSWQLQEAKNKLSQVIDEAQEEGPQVITRRGVEVVVVIAYEQYRRMVASREKLSDFFKHSPLSETNLDLSRDKSEIRDEIGL